MLVTYERCGKLVLSQNDLQMLGLLYANSPPLSHTQFTPGRPCRCKCQGQRNRAFTGYDTSGHFGSRVEVKKNMVQFEGIFNGWDNMWSIRSEYWFIVVHRWFFMVVDVYLWLCLIIYGSYWVQLGTITPSSWGPYNCGILYPLITRSCLTPFWRNESIYIIHHNPSLIDVWLMFVGCMGISKREIVGNIMASSEYPNLFWSTSCSQVHI
jgi:hypothetical protein